MYSIIATTLAGSFMIASLTMGYDTAWPILISAGAGAVVAIPVSYFVARAMMNA